MTRKQRRKISEFIRGYRAGYTFHGLHFFKIAGESDAFKHGYFTARKDYREGEPPLY